jgi:hypothetical protein
VLGGMRGFHCVTRADRSASRVVIGTNWGRGGWRKILIRHWGGSTMRRRLSIPIVVDAQTVSLAPRHPPGCYAQALTSCPAPHVVGPLRRPPHAPFVAYRPPRHDTVLTGHHTDPVALSCHASPACGSPTALPLQTHWAHRCPLELQ